MNCKPGQMAVVVKSRLGTNLGKIVKTVRLASTDELLAALPFTEAPKEPVWLLEVPNIKWGFPNGSTVGTFPYQRDDYLRPLPDVPEDEVEVLYSAGKPVTI